MLTRKRDKTYFCIGQVMWGEKCWTEHRLVRVKINFVEKQKHRQSVTDIPKLLHVKHFKFKTVRIEC